MIDILFIALDKKKQKKFVKIEESRLQIQKSIEFIYVIRPCKSYEKNQTAVKL